MPGPVASGLLRRRDGFAPTRNSPLAFDAEGNLFLFGIDYKGLNYRLLINGQNNGGAANVGSMQFWGILAVIGATMAWATGSIYGLRSPVPKSSIQTSGMQMLSGGLVLLFVKADQHGAFTVQGSSLRVVGGVDIASEVVVAKLRWISWTGHVKYRVHFGAITPYVASEVPLFFD